MKIIISGELSECRFLTGQLSSKGYSVTILNKDIDECRMLSKINSRSIVINGDATHPDDLDNAKISHMDIAAALTQSDSENLMFCRLAKNVFKVPRTFSIVNDPQNIEVFKKLGIDTVMSPSHTLSMIIEQNISVDDITNLMPVNHSRLAVFNLEIKQSDPCVNKKVMDLMLPQESNIVYILRGNDPIVPSGETFIMDGDTVLMVSLPNVQSKTILSLKGSLD